MSDEGKGQPVKDEELDKVAGGARGNTPPGGSGPPPNRPPETTVPIGRIVDPMP